MKTIVFAGGLALLGTLLGTRLAILILVKKGYGQLIRDDGPTSHHVKRGTPTMGGLVIIAAVVLAYFGSHLITFTRPLRVGVAGALPVHRPGRRRFSGRLHQDQQTALSRPTEQGQDRWPIKSSPSSSHSPHCSSPTSGELRRPRLPSPSCGISNGCNCP